MIRVLPRVALATLSVICASCSSGVNATSMRPPAPVPVIDHVDVVDEGNCASAPSTGGADVAFGRPSAGYLDIWSGGRLLTWVENGSPPDGLAASGDTRSLTDRHILVCDLQTSRVRRAVSSIPGGFVFAPRGGGPQASTLVYTAVARDPGSSEPAMWSIVAIELPSMNRRVLRSSTVPATPDTLPVASVDGRWAAWGEPATQGGSVDVHVADLQTGQEKQLRAAVRATAVSVMNGVVYFDDQAATGDAIFAMPADGSALPYEVVATSGGSFPVARNGALAWVQERAASDGRPASAFDEYVLDLGAAQRRPFRVGTNGYGNTFPGSGFALYLEPRGLIAHSSCSDYTTPGAVVSSGAIAVSAGWASVGDVIAFATIGADSRGRTLHVISAAAHGIQRAPC